MVEEARLAGLKLILSLADNWKYHGGVDEYVDRSESAPKRGPDQRRPPDQLGDADLTVRLPAICLTHSLTDGLTDNLTDNAGSTG